jgi:rubrerythrin
MPRAAMTLHDILQLAIESEVRSAAFYRHLQGNAVRTEAAELLGRLALEEERHEALLRALLNAVPDDPVDPDVVEQARSAHAVFVTLHAASSWAEVRTLAVERERRAERLYRHLATRCEPGEQQDLYLLLAEEEEAHGDLLSTLEAPDAT